ncbi:unnamed protein product [Bursaphelenchus xylophilus]|uniref:(pine wood nematode) hypothetical protein n=1 Tax=Bursaphelenchus xylophilus TaxID=6326 RepID=A0A1I7S3Y2_BURXY|nr:unnamed protein product [Bursaphelenchus xylophilus]CAG9116559.1 unnamed protein product [Bursaphelenchus xylophilus]
MSEGVRKEVKLRRRSSSAHPLGQGSKVRPRLRKDTFIKPRYYAKDRSSPPSRSDVIPELPPSRPPPTPIFVSIRPVVYLLPPPIPQYKVQVIRIDIQ